MFPSLHRHGDWGLLALRLVIGIIFVYHGLSKWQMDGLSPILTLLKFVEPIGGVALILGVLSQLAAAGLGIIMLGAIYMKASGFGQQQLDFAGSFSPSNYAGWEFDLMIFAGCLTLFLMGAGSLSADAMIFKKSKKKK